MGAISIPGTPTFVVRWSCRRCGHTGGVAKTAVPIVTKDWTEPMIRNLLDALRQKLVKVHMRQGKCIPTIEDFIIERGCEEDVRIVGLV